MDNEEKTDNSETDVITDATSQISIKEINEETVKENIIKMSKETNLKTTTTTTTTTKPKESETIKSEIIKKLPNPMSDANTDLEWKNAQYFLAEAASAPKHLVRYTSQEKLTKLINAYKEQSTTAVDKQLNFEPSCSVLPTSKEIISDDSLKSSLKKPLTSEKDETKRILKILTETYEHSPEIQKPSVVPPTPPPPPPAAAATVTAAAEVLPVKQLDVRLPIESSTDVDPTPAPSVRSIGSLVCRICHNSENPERLVSPCLCKGSLSFVHIHCLERWISTSRSTVCELCQFQYNTEQTLRYTCIQSLRMWYSRSMSRRALQEDCQMFSLLTLVAFGIIGTLLVGIQYYFIQGRHWGLSSVWTKGWLLFFLFTTLLVYFINIYMIVRSQLAPWYRWWQSARDIKLILENRKPFKILPGRRVQRTSRQLVSQAITEQQQQQQEQQPQPTSQSPIVPQILPPITSPTTTSPTSQAPLAPPTPPMHSTTASFIVTAIPSMHNAINVSHDRNCGKPDAKTTTTMMTTTKSTTTTTTTLTPTLNKLQISVELTTMPAEIIETPLEDFDRCAFEYVTAIV